jgi:hypothetical protein
LFATARARVEAVQDRHSAGQRRARGDVRRAWAETTRALLLELETCLCQRAAAEREALAALEAPIEAALRASAVPRPLAPRGCRDAWLRGLWRALARPESAAWAHLVVVSLQASAVDHLFVLDQLVRARAGE